MPHSFLINTRLRPINFHLSLFLLESADGHLVKSQQGLVRVLDEDILAIFHVPAHVNDRANNTPSVGKIEVHLLSEFTWIIAHDAENDVPVGSLGGRAGDETGYKVRKVGV